MSESSKIKRHLLPKWMQDLLTETERLDSLIDQAKLEARLSDEEISRIVRPKSSSKPN